jgi:hypothetical protein
MVRVRVVAAKPLSSQTNRTGRLNTLAQVQPFEERAAVDRAVAEDAADDAALALSFTACAAPAAMTMLRRHDPVRAEHADGKVGDVHRAALAAAVAALGGQRARASWRGVGAFGQRVAVARDGREQDVVCSRLRQTPEATASCPIEGWMAPSTIFSASP